MSNEKKICDVCGEIIHEEHKYGGYVFCSPECKEFGKEQIRDLEGADKYDSERDKQLEQN